MPDLPWVISGNEKPINSGCQLATRKGLIKPSIIEVAMNKELNKPYKAVVLGAAGKVGKKLINKLLQSNRCTHLTVVSRKPIPKHPKLTNEIWQDLSAFWQKQSIELKAIFSGADVLFCCMGGVKASGFSQLFSRKKSARMFQSVDYYYIVGSATIAQLASVPPLSVIASPNAAKKSPLLISQMQWKMQEEVQNMGFPGVSIFQPGCLLAPVDQAGSTWRLLLNHMKVAFCHFISGHQEAIGVDDVASAMKLEYELRLTGKISNTAFYQSNAMRELLQCHQPQTIN